MSITGAYTQNWSQWWMPNNETQITYYQFMAKNDIPANSIMFPICLFATERDYTFANHIIATGLFSNINNIIRQIKLLLML